MSDRFNKDMIVGVLRNLPDDITLVGAIEHLIYLRKIEIGLSQLEKGQTVALEQINLLETADPHTQTAREATVAALYGDGRLSGREARTLLGLSRREFEEMLSRRGVSVLIDTNENIRIELDQGDG